MTDWTAPDVLHVATAGELLAVVERIERLEEEKRGVSEQIKEVYAEAKGAGFDAKTLRKIVALRRLDRDERQEAEALLETYEAALEKAQRGGAS